MPFPELLNINRTSASTEKIAPDVTAIAAALDQLNGYVQTLGLGYFHVIDPIFSPPADRENGDWSTAILAASEAALNRAGSGTVWFPTLPHSLKVSCPYVQSLAGVNPNCQLPLPLHTLGEQGYTLTWRGADIPSFVTEGAGAHPRIHNGPIIESTVIGSGTKPSVVGSAWVNNGVTGQRNYIKFMMFNMTVRCCSIVNGVDVPNVTTAINASRLIQFGGDEIKVDVSSTLVGLKEPNGSIGVWFPDLSNKAELGVGFVMAEGFADGLVLGEHTCIQRVLAAGNVRAITTTGGYGCSIQHVDLELNRVNLHMDAEGDLVILNYNTEHYTGVEGERWYNYLADITSASSGACRIVNSVVRRSGGGFHLFATDNQVKYSVMWGDGANSLPDDKAKVDAKNALSPYFRNTEFDQPGVTDYDMGMKIGSKTSMPGNGTATVTDGDGTIGTSVISQRTHGMPQGRGTTIRVNIISLSGRADLINDAAQVLASWTTPGVKEMAVGAAKDNPIYGLLVTGNAVFDYFRPQ